MYLLIIFLPLFSFYLSTYFGKYFGFMGVSKVTILCMLLTLSLTLITIYEILFYKSLIYLDLFYWIDSELLTINWSFMFDYLTITMCFIVIFISFLVHLYSIEYMYYDPFLTKFMGYLSLFTFFMLILITSGNILQMFIGWEGVGLCSYLLINFWSIRVQANKAAIKAMILNRIGDFGLIIGILFIFINFKTMDYNTLAILIPFYKTKTIIFDFNLISSICLCLFIGSIGKSAQLGLHTWLPDAMEGPTPVSALIHAATMVTAGVFLIIRLSFFFENSNKIYEFLTIIGAMSSLLASVTGLVQNDAKKIVAYSTCSQLGYMVFSCGLNDYFMSLFHLTNHAFFKAQLFLSAGSIIHGVQNEQDIRKLGGLKNLLPFSYINNIIGSLALTGFPFLTGFYSKDFILEFAVTKFSIFSWFCYFIGSFGAFITAFYSFRSIYLIFLAKPNGYKKVICFSIESKINIKLVLFLLSIPSFLIGYLSKDLLIGFGSNFFNNAVFINLKSFNIIDCELILLFYKLFPISLSLFGLFLAFFSYYYYFYFLFEIKKLNLILKLYNFFNRKWFFDKIYNELLGQFFYKFSYSISYKFVDRGVFDIFGPNGLSFILLKFSFIFNKLQNDHIYYSLVTIIVSLTFLIIQLYLFKIFSLNLIVINMLVLLYLL